MKNGVIESTTKCGKFSASRTYLDIPKATEASGLKEEGTVVLKQANKILDKVTGKIRDLFAGKDVCTKNPVRDKFKRVEPLKAKDIEEKLKSCYKMPNGKLVEKKEFEKTINEYFKARSEQAIKNPHQADKIIKELKDLDKQVKNQIGYEIPNNWIKYLGKGFFK